MDGVRLDFSEDALCKISELAKNMGMGARSLRSVVDQPMVDLMFELPSLEGITGITVGEDFFSARRMVLGTRADGTTERVSLPESA